jgi:plastocyanin
MSRTRLLTMITVPALALALTVTAACGGDSNDPSAKSANAAPVKVEGAAAAPAASEQTIVMLDNKFEPKDLTVRAGQEVTLVVDNKGGAIHNWRIMNAKGKDGKPIQTTLMPGGKTEMLKFTIEKAGTYELVCDVHHAEMRGKLLAQ